MIKETCLNDCEVVQNNHVTGGHAQGGKPCLYSHLGGAKALFFYINNIQVTDFVGGPKLCKFLSWGKCLRASCKCLPGTKFIIAMQNTLEVRSMQFEKQSEYKNVGG